MEEGRSAHLIIQHAHLVKLNQSLNAKENKKEGDRTILFTGGLGRHLTDSEVTDQLIAQNQRKEAKAAEKAKRKSGHEADAAAQAAVEAEWKVIITEHAKAVEDWQKECEVLLETVL